MRSSASQLVSPHRIGALVSQIQKVSYQLELTKSAPQLVVNRE